MIVAIRCTPADKRRKIITIEVDDTVFFDRQPREFRELFNELRVGDIAEFDNYIAAYIPSTGRIIMSRKEVQDGE